MNDPTKTLDTLDLVIDDVARMTPNGMLADRARLDAMRHLNEVRDLLYAIQHDSQRRYSVVRADGSTVKVTVPE